MAAGSRVAPERGVGEGDPEAVGTAPRPAELRPRSQVRATGLAGDLGLGAGVHCLVLPFKMKAFVQDMPLPGALPRPIVRSLLGATPIQWLLMWGVHWLGLLA